MIIQKIANKKGALPIDSWIDYLLFFVFALFATIFLFTFLSLSLLFREENTIRTVESLIVSENLINEQKELFAAGGTADINLLKERVGYISPYKPLPPLKQEFEPKE